MEIYEGEESEINFWWKDTYYWLTSSSIFIYVPLGITPIFQEVSGGRGRWGESWKNSSYVWKTRTKKKARERERGKKGQVPNGFHCAHSKQILLSALKKKKKKKKKVRPWSWEDHTALSRNCSDEVSPISIQKLL